jgi:hypothetical protein
MLLGAQVIFFRHLTPIHPAKPYSKARIFRCLPIHVAPSPFHVILRCRVIIPLHLSTGSHVDTLLRLLTVSLPLRRTRKTKQMTSMSQCLASKTMPIRNLDVRWDAEPDSEGDGETMWESPSPRLGSISASSPHRFCQLIAHICLFRVSSSCTECHCQCHNCDVNSTFVVFTILFSVLSYCCKLYA